MTSVNGFPEDFRFGVATAAYQIEGAVREDGRGESIWDRFSHTPGTVDGGDTGDIACDHYHRWRADLDLMQALGVESYRFSISWPRVLPEGNVPRNQQGIDFYRRLVEGLLERGIEPIATLYHWDLPQALQAIGGWDSRETTHRFADYAALMADELSDVSEWITHNEPWVVAFLGHAHGVKAPGLCDWPIALRVSHHLLLSHGMARAAIRAALPDARVGVSLNLAPVHAASDSDEDVAAARRQDGHLNRWFLDPLLRGGYPTDMVELWESKFGRMDAVRDGDLELISQPLDFLGVNYYFPQRVRNAPASGSPLELEHAPATPPLTAMGWEVDPQGLRDLLVRLRTDYDAPPIYITENGAAFEDPPLNGSGCVDDTARTDYLQGHMAALREAIAEGVDVRRYCLWSLLDNFEWEHGYAMRFGIVHVDYESQRRVPKRSGLWYRDYIHGIRNGGVGS